MTDPDARTALDMPALIADLQAAGWAGPIPTLLDTTESTNSDVARLAEAGAVEGSCIVAEHQSAGRGRLDRQWVSPHGAGLWMSVLVRPADMPRSSWSWLPLLAGLASANAIRSVTGVQAEVKWPNDLVVVDHSSRKLGGILSEAHGDDAVVVGIGLNVSMTRAELPVPTATSITLEGGSAGREALLAAVLGNFARCLARWRAQDAQLFVEYRDLCASIGRVVEATLPDSVIVHGLVLDVDDNGQLIVDDGTANVMVTAGDVIHASI
ncbi:MAG: biotin--[acetyl-CoA-carboxylase] ligase [Actinomycetota bacterium]|nr:biotin--[acetyl-CoA-carboxylase] ligase [Actinomycetota bacterium]